MVIDADGQRIGRFESSELDWKRGDVFDLDDRSWRIVEILRSSSRRLVVGEAVDHVEQERVRSGLWNVRVRAGGQRRF